MGDVPEFKLNKVLDIDEAAEQKRNAAGEIFNALALFSRQLGNLVDMVDKPLTSFILGILVNIVWNNTKVLMYLVQPSKYLENRNPTLLPICLSVGNFISRSTEYISMPEPQRVKQT